MLDTGKTVGPCGLIVWPDIDGSEEIEVAYLLAATIRVAEKIGMRFEKDFEYHGKPMALFAWSASRSG